MVSFNSSSRFPLSSGASVDNPVMFPPGRARLAMNLLPTGSVSFVMTMGIVVVASFAARVGNGPAVTMMSTLRRTSSAASAGRRSSFPSAYRNSMTIFFPRRNQGRADLGGRPRCGPIQRKGRNHLGILSAGFSLAVRLGREAGSKEQGAKSKENDFLTHCFPSCFSDV